MEQTRPYNSRWHFSPAASAMTSHPSAVSTAVAPSPVRVRAASAATYAAGTTNEIAMIRSVRASRASRAAWSRAEKGVGQDPTETGNQ